MVFPVQKTALLSPPTDGYLMAGTAATPASASAKNREDGETLPKLRQDLTIEPGDPFWTGAPSFIIFDAARNRYFRLGEFQLQLLTHWKSVDSEALAEKLSRILNREISAIEVEGFAKFLVANSLVELNDRDAWKGVMEQHRVSQQSLIKKAVHSYLFFRIPLINPQKLLDTLWPFVGILFTRAAALVFVAIALISLFLVSRQWDVFQSTFMDFLSLDGFMFYASSLVIIKIIHEMGHALMARKYHVAVPTIGIAFIVMMPILYTDTTAAHRLRSRITKLHIDLAGIYAELALACIATLLWVFLDDGPARSVAFTTATLSWVLSLAVNLNPFMRFDGYYILSDLTGFENLQERGFAFAKWKLRELLFGAKIPPPEAVPLKWHLPIILHAWGTWIYRFFLFLAIAVIVYAFFIKVVGIFLFIVEIAWFIIMPIWREFKHWWSMRQMILKTKRSLTSAFLFTVAILALFLPLDNEVSVPAIMKTIGTKDIYSPKAAKIALLTLQNGQVVNGGDVLAVLVSDQLLEDKSRIEREIRLYEARLARSQSNAEDHSLRLVLQSELDAKREEWQGNQDQINQLTILAPVSGMIVDADPN
ncbi:MAG: hypothetical protein WBC71_09515, partial [Salaquimonas sp.]